MHRTTCSRPGLRLLLIAAIICLPGVQVLAQGEEQAGDLVYRFKLPAITTYAEAKPVQHALMQLEEIHMCLFIEEEACFKLASPTAHDLGSLRTLLAGAGQVLEGPVHVSDGTTLTDGQAPSPAR